MKLENRFTVPVPKADAWKVLLDVERIAPCLPGATLTGHDGDTFDGTVKVKVGPINLTYGGTAKFLSLDEAAGVAVIEGAAKETRGTGTAKAIVTMRLVDQGGTTDVEVDTDLNVTGKPASFGRGVLADVSSKLVDQFAACLAEEIRSGGVAPEPATAPEAASSDTGVGAASAASSAVAPSAASSAGAPSAAGSAGASTASAIRKSPPRQAEAINLLDTAGAPVLKRLAPVLLALVAVVLLLRRLRK